jgi:hypothetical protein
MLQVKADNNVPLTHPSNVTNNFPNMFLRQLGTNDVGDCISVAFLLEYACGARAKPAIELSLNESTTTHGRAASLSL